jgi:hypothetical protein
VPGRVAESGHVGPWNINTGCDKQDINRRKDCSFQINVIKYNAEKHWK